MTNWATVYVQNNTSRGTYTSVEFERLVWSQRYQFLYQYNRCPWVAHGYDVFAVENVLVLPRGSTVPVDGWLCELLDTSDSPGALGYHEGHEFVSKEGPSGKHSTRGKALHPDTGTGVVLMKVFAKTSKADGVPVGEVVSHEIGESAVDPFVDDEATIRKYLNPAAHEWWIAEVGDPVQGRAYDVGAPEGRPCGVPEAIVSDIAYPGLWGQPQRRHATSLASDPEVWTGAPPPARNLDPFTVAPEGYMSVAPENDPTNWTQIYGSDKVAAEARRRAYEGPDEVG